MKKLIAVFFTIIFTLNLYGIDFTKEEKDYLKQNPEVEIGILDSYAPFSFYYRGSFQGYLLDLLSLIEAKTGLKFKQRPGSWSDILTAFKEDKIPLISGITKSKTREAYTLFSKPYFLSDITLYTRDDVKDFKGLSSLSGKSIGIVRNIFYANETKQLKDIKIHEYASTDSVMQALSYGWVDAAAMMDIVGEYKIKEYHLDNIKDQGSIAIGDFKQEDLRFGAKKNNPILIAILDKALKAVPKEQNRALIDKWLKKYQETLDNKYAPIHDIDVSMINDFIAKDLYNVDIASIDEKLQNFMLHKNLCSITVIDTLINKTVAEKNNSSCDGFTKEQTTDIMHDGEKIGILKVVQNDAGEMLSLTEKEKTFLKQHPIITVGNQMDYEPFDFMKNGEPAGFAIDYLKILQEKIPGIKFRFLNGYHWNMLKNLFDEEKIDLLISEENSLRGLKNTVTTEPYLELYSAIATKKDTHLNSIEDIITQDKTLAVVRGFSYAEGITKHFPDIKLFYVTSPIKALRAITSGEADAYIDSGVLIEYLVNKYMLSDIRVSMSANLKPIEKHDSEIAIRGDWKVLRDIIQKAMDKVSQDELNMLRNKWFGKKFELLETPIELSDQEKIFLNRHPVLKVPSRPDWAPFDFSVGGQVQGFSVDMLNLIAKKLGFEVQYVDTDTYIDELEMFKNGQVDLLLNHFKSRDMENTGSFSYPYFKVNFVTARKKGTPSINSLSDLNKKIAAIPKNYASYINLNKRFPNIKILSVNNTLETLNAVENGEADAAILEASSARYYIQKNFLEDIVLDANLKGVDTPYQEELYFMVQKEYPELLSMIDKAITSLSHAETNEITAKWIFAAKNDSKQINLNKEEIAYLRQKPFIRICTGPSRMPFVGVDEKNTLTGIASDFLDKLSSISGITFKRIDSTDWENVKHLIDSKSCDLVPLVGKSEYMSDSLLFTSPYIEAHAVYITGDNHPYIADIKEVKNKIVAMPKGYPITEFFQKEYPNLDIHITDDYDAAFKMVAQDKAHMSVDFLMSADMRIKRLKLYNLKFAGNTPYAKGFSVGVSKNEPELFSIIQKAASKISQDEIDAMVDKWVSLKFEYGFDYALFWKMLGVTAVILVGIFFWNYKLAKLNREIQRKNTEVITQKELVEKKNSELEQVNRQISDSINYATYIQCSFLPNLEQMKKDFDDIFVIWEPRDKVGGDLYFYDSCSKGFLIAAIDCTGHGVPGGFITMIVGSTIRRLREEESFSDNPAELLQYLNIYIKHQLNQSKPDTLSDDGLDISMCYIDRDTKELTFSGAKLPLLYVEDGEVTMIKGDCQSIGYKKSKTDFIYTNRTLPYKRGRSFYLFTDGIIDQTGGKKGFPYGIRKFKKLLLELQGTAFDTQGERILAATKEYQGDHKRRDDLTLIGFKI